TNPFGEKLVFAGGATGVIGYVVNPGPNAEFQLYVTGSNVQGQNPNQIASFLDTGSYDGGFSSGNFSTLAFAGDVGGSPNGNENFAGLAFAPGSPGGGHASPRGKHLRAGAAAAVVDGTLLAGPGARGVFVEPDPAAAATLTGTPTPLL